MKFFDVANQPLVYVLVAIGLVLVAAMAVISARRAYRRCLDAGLSKEQLKGVISSSASFSVVPSISIVIGLISLSALIGIPWAWWRLSVVGSVMYETTAANMAAKAMGFETFTNAPAAVFGAVLYVMTIGIIFGIVMLIVAGKPLMLGYAKQRSKGSWGLVSNSCFLLAMFAALVPSFFVEGTVYILTFFSSMLLAVLISVIAKKTGAKWLSEFTLAICLIGAMCLSVLWAGLFA